MLDYVPLLKPTNKILSMLTHNTTVEVPSDLMCLHVTVNFTYRVKLKYNVNLVNTCSRA